MIPKFRAWDKKEKRIDLIDEIIFSDEYVIMHNGAIRGFDEVVIMQSTGLADVNSKEIFEGDIVKALSEGYCGTFQVIWRNEGTPMYILYPAWQNEQFWDLKGVNGVDDGIEVIGNIHEHPELLNQPDE
ncbi:hypothetical protein CW685_00425 [Macrococcoides caseolyticum]|uniref:YopX family protein n=1 Tax=Macrococcoides caseolyticum TaxID=69966 RepID=UPI000C34A857|nr:YopX family protein [Macrococcus caseolyticus]PKE13226.1 hypothetical protein CW685_00425 [Macrococcus caseolyticus]